MVILNIAHQDKHILDLQYARLICIPKSHNLITPPPRMYGMMMYGKLVMIALLLNFLNATFHQMPHVLSLSQILHILLCYNDNFLSS